MKAVRSAPAGLTATESNVLLKTLIAFKKGNFAVRMPVDQIGVAGKIADALNDIAKAEYSLDGGDWMVAPPTTGLSDSLELDYDLTLDAPPGEHTIAVRVQDSYDNLSVDKAVVR